jgi:hypothetical protein
VHDIELSGRKPVEMVYVTGIEFRIRNSAFGAAQGWKIDIHPPQIGIWPHHFCQDESITITAGDIHEPTSGP